MRVLLCILAVIFGIGIIAEEKEKKIEALAVCFVACIIALITMFIK